MVSRFLVITTVLLKAIFYIVLVKVCMHFCRVELLDYMIYVYLALIDISKQFSNV